MQNIREGIAETIASELHWTSKKDYQSMRFNMYETFGTDISQEEYDAGYTQYSKECEE